MQTRRSFLTYATVALGLALSGAPIYGQGRDRDRHDHDRFDDHDRQVARDWYRDHHDAFRHDEGRYWHREWEPNIREGYVLTPDMRAGIRPVPRDLRLAPAPPGYRYVMIGDHIVLVDRGYRIHDVLHFELNF